MSNICDLSMTESMETCEEEQDVILSQRIENWAILTQKLLQENVIQSWLKSVKKLPDNILALYDDIEFSSGIRFGSHDRQKYYDAFNQMTSGLGTVAVTDIEALVKTKLGFNVTRKGLESIVQSRLDETASDPEKHGPSATNGFDFEQFLSLLCELVQSPEIRVRTSMATPRLLDKIRNSFPLDPESGVKMFWDMFCLLLLLYCSFSVPYGLAFDSSAPGIQTFSDLLDLTIDALFLFDMALSFATAYDLQARDSPLWRLFVFGREEREE